MIDRSKEIAEKHDHRDNMRTPEKASTRMKFEQHVIIMLDVTSDIKKTDKNYALLKPVRRDYFY